MFKKALTTAAVLSALSVTLSGNVAAQAQYEGKTLHEWWPEKLNLQPLRQQDPRSNPYGEDFSYAEAFESLDLAAVKADITAVLTESQDWWPADYGNYGPFFIRMAWHGAGTYRVSDGRGGADGAQQRFEPLNSWPDNVSLDKARRLLWPVKQKYGRSISWGDLMALTGTVAMEAMGFETFGFAGGRVDQWEPDMTYWGPEEKMMDDKRYSGKRDLANPLAAVQMGLIYVNPEGPNGNPDPKLAAHDIRETFGRMAMNDEETVALIAGGHTFGKAHGAHKPDECVGVDPAAAPLEQQGFGWKNKCGKGHSEDTVTSGLEGAWTAAPTQWSMMYLSNLWAHEWELTKSPAGAHQWVPKGGAAAGTVPDAHVKGKMHAPMMFTTDLSLKFDPSYAKISKRFLENPKEFEKAFAKAWFKLTHRDMGPRARYLGDLVPEEVLIWQDPVPAVDHKLIDDGDAAWLKAEIMDSGLSVQDLVKTAWGAAASFRDTDMRGGANGARIALAPQNTWEVNEPKTVAKVVKALEKIQKSFNKKQKDGTKVSLADLIVLGGAAAIEKAAADGGYDVTVPFVPGRTDATQDMTDVNSFAVLEPKADAFRNYFGKVDIGSPAEHMVEKSNLLGLSVPEMTALIGGMRAIGANTGGSKHGVFTDKPGALTNDFFVNLLSMDTVWEKDGDVYVGKDRDSGKKQWTATPVDLVFGANSELRAVSEAYAESDAGETFVNDFVNAWVKVMQNDRFDLM